MAFESAAPGRKQRAAVALEQYDYLEAYAVIEMAGTGIQDGPRACPKGLRHGFSMQTARKGVALVMAQKWLGHAYTNTTAIIIPRLCWRKPE